jgi:hypothetical protein
VQGRIIGQVRTFHDLHISRSGWVPTSLFRKVINHSNPRVADAFGRLQLASDDLMETFDDYARKHPDTPHLSGENFQSAFKIAQPDGAVFVSGAAFGEIIEQVLISRTNQKKTIASKVGQQLGHLYPLATLILGLASSAADVSVVSRPYW